MPYLLELLARGAILSALVLLLGALPGVRRLAAHGTMVTIAMVWLVMLPALVVAGPRVTLALLPAEQATAPAPDAVRTTERPVAASIEAGLPEPRGPAASQVSVAPSGEFLPVPLQAYLFVVVAILLWRVLGSVHVHRMVARSRQASVDGRIAAAAENAARRIGLRAVPGLRISREVPLPVVFGIWRPVVILPPDADSWLGARLDAVLLHEMAHIRRRDILARLVADVACALHWFNPLVWVAAARLRAEAEVACDQAVVHAGIGAEAYANELLQLARTYNGAPLLVPAIGIVGASSLAARVRAILNFAGPRVSRIHVLAGSALACVTALAAAVVVPVQMRAQGQAFATLNISSGGPEISSNGAGLQARWNDHGRHSAMFVTGDVGLGDVASGKLQGAGRLLLVQEKTTGGIDVFEWQGGQSNELPEAVRQSLVTGAGQLQSLSGRHRGFPGSSMTGLPAWSDDPNAHVVQAGWKEGSVRYGVALRGTWQNGRERLESETADGWLVLFAFDTRRGSVRTLEIQPDGQVSYHVNGVASTYDARVHDWSADAFRLLQRIKPPDIEF